MRRELRPAPRAGFTLIELLVVIAILAVLAALVAAGIGRVQTAQRGRVTDQTVTKLQLALDNQWKAICDNCRDDRRSFATPNKQQDFVNMVAICDGDVDRAESLWMYMKLRQNMPQTFAEATSNVVVSNAAKTVSVTLLPSSTFRQLPTGTGALEESAALLYMIVGQGGRGTNFSVDDATQGAQMSVTAGGSTFPAFKDGYGNPIVFVRFFQSDEVLLPPYVRIRPALTAGAQQFDDPLDQAGRLFLWTNATVKNQIQPQLFAQPLYFTMPPYLTPLNLPSPLLPTAFNGRNRLPVVISTGVDASSDPNDNVFGYRLTRQGNKGD
ncbi:MAG TPA: prepilin-type N-terminal cleavage/methylation domain-containing protein [Urbifossiella sp.]|jgi:prepilin-type N-terminal cleavage/methylation domain-containing protein|nr:prepilin-type N-terminal cleavage/methylation domain-containing protein [Urbifossiella sp.]